MRLADRVLALMLALSATSAAAGQDAVTFASRVASLSEPGGYFDTDNLISNERSYLHVVPELEALSGPAGRNGVYLGVGPDQNFSYIARLRPKAAILIDIRRDSLLLHLLFKALFEQARTRVEYLAMLTGRPAPEPVTGWSSKPLDAIVAHLDRAQPMTAAQVSALRSRLTGAIRAYGVPLSDRDLATIDRFHRRFIEEGLSLQFNTTGRAPRFGYPTYRDLLLEVDLKGRRCSFVAAEDDFLFVKGLQSKDQVIPLVGDLSGPKALAAVGALLAARNQQVTAFYTSNVEFYLFSYGTFPRFVTNLRRLPHHPNALIIRSVFPSGGAFLDPRPGYNSVSTTQPIQALLDGQARGEFKRYAELVR
jgi:hypothetical protein